MSGGIGDDEKGAPGSASDALSKHDLSAAHAAPAAHDLSPAAIESCAAQDPATIHDPSTVASVPPAKPASEWTASDRRGPLRSLTEDADGTERLLPAGETEAVRVPHAGLTEARDGNEPAHAEAGASETHEGGSVAGSIDDHEVIHPATGGVDVPQADGRDRPPMGETLAATHADSELERTQAEQTRIDDQRAALSLDAPSAVTPPVEPARRSLWPVGLGLIAGAVLGAGTAALVDGTRTTSVPPAVASKLDDLSSRVDALDRRGDPSVEIDGLKRRLNDLAGRASPLDAKGASVVRPSKTAAADAPPSSSAASNSAQPGASAPSSPPAQTGASAQPNSSAQASASTQPSPSVRAGTSAPAASPGEVGTPAGDLATRVAALQSGLDSQGKQGGSRDAALKALSGKIEALQASLVGLQAATLASRSSADTVKNQQHDLDGKLTALQTAVGGTTEQVSAVKTNLATVQGEQRALAGKLGAPALAVVTDSLVAQIEGGKPYGTQVDALAALGADPAKVAVLRENAGKGVPSAQVLLASFAPLADPVIATATKAPANAGLGDRLKHGLFGLVNVRRADETTGNDLPSRVALLQSDLAHGDVLGAFAVWNALPADAKARSDGWGTQAKTSVEAITAARGLQSSAIGALAAKKS